jgi:hypothetical protein
VSYCRRDCGLCVYVDGDFVKEFGSSDLIRKYALRRDIARSSQNKELNFVEGITSGVACCFEVSLKVLPELFKHQSVEQRKTVWRGCEGYQKGLLGLLVKPMNDLSDAVTYVMIGVRVSVNAGWQSGRGVLRMPQLRPCCTMYGKDCTLRVYSLAYAAASTLMHCTKLSGDNYLSHLDIGDRVLLVSDKKMVLLGSDGQELLLMKFKHITSTELHQTNGRKQ